MTKTPLLTAAALGIAATALTLGAAPAMAACDDGEIVIKFSHVTNTDKHPKGIAASLLEERVNDEMNGKACMEVFPNSSLYDDDKVLEAMLAGDVQLAAPSLSQVRDLHQEVPAVRSALRLRGHQRRRPLPAIRGRPGASGVDDAARADRAFLLA